MFAPANTAAFTLDIPGIAHDFKVLSFTGIEAISQPYCFQLELVSERPDLDIEALLQQPAFFTFAGQGKGIHGLIHRVAQGDAGKRLTRYHIDLVPHLAYLGHRTNQRIFQHLTVPEIISRVLNDHGIQTDAFRFQLNSDYPQRIYCTQYDETDLHFIQRLCEEEGIHFHFEHSIENHLLVFGDDQTGFPKLVRPTVYIQDSGLVADEPVIKRFAMRIETRPSRVTRRDYDFEKPHLLMEAAHGAEQSVEGDEQPVPLPDLEDYDYPGRFTQRARGKQLAKRSLERHRSDYRLAEGKSDVPSLVTGHFLTLSEHPRTEWNDLWLVVSIQHEGKQPQVLEESVTSDVKDSDGFAQGYRNQFTAAPWDVQYRPQLDHPKPKVPGTQTVVVTGPEGEEIHCDQYGRIKVQFHWDREGQGDERTSCWLRVASGWTGNQYGGIAIPRVGMEVLITFLEGDPDQPLVTGCLYHKTHPAPYELPANKTRSVFKTLSSPGGGGYNELRIEDKKDQEQIYIHAQRDWDENIENDQKIRVGNERHDRAEANSYTEFMAEEHHTTHSDRKSEIRASDHLTIGTSQNIKLGTGQFIEAGNEIHYYAGDKVVIDAGMELTARGGGSFLKLDPSGVTLSGPGIKINLGGSPGKGDPARALLPGALLAVDQDLTGNMLTAAAPQPLPTFKTALSGLMYDIEEEEEELEIELPLEQTITLRIGVFFDGTGNNEANSRSMIECRAEDLGLEDLAEDIREHCAKHGYDGEGSSPDNSYGNNVTNVARLFELYTDEAGMKLPDGATKASLAVYLEGTGTTSGSEDSLYSQGTGIGDTGALARVGQTPDAIMEEISYFRQSNPGILIEHIEVDVFGFSRGAASARHFANDLQKGKNSLLARHMQTETSMFASTFSWRPKQDISLGFIGLFDTVAGIVSPLHGDLSPANEDNHGLELGLNSGVARRIVQLVAADEYRYNFALNSAGQADIFVPGAHSDVGGGYLTSSREKVLLSRPRRSQVPRHQPNERTGAWMATQEELKDREAELKRQGLEPEIISWDMDIDFVRKRDSHPEKKVYCALKSEREVRGELSLVYMRIMRELAVREGVPFDAIDENDNRTALPDDLAPIAAKLQNYALGGALQPSMTDAEQALLYRRYIHLSANWNTKIGQTKNGLSVIFINRPARDNTRRIYPNG